MDSVYFVRLGANADIRAYFTGETLLHAAEQKLAEQSDPEEKQRYEKVHEDTHTITHFYIANGWWQESCTYLILYNLSNMNFFKHETLLFALCGNILENSLQHHSHFLN